MPATHLDQITDEAIRARLAQASYATVSWTERMPAYASDWDVLAGMELDLLTVRDVREQLQQDLSGDTLADEIDMAIAIAAEPDGLPENACVNVHYDEEDG